jgi:TIR domain
MGMKERELMEPMAVGMHEKPTASEADAKPARPFIFIVYPNHENRLVQALKDLLESWGFEAFFCRQEIRELATSVAYRRDLATRLKRADLVILILSNDFRYSQYCQAEAGATMTLGKPQIQILIPPVTTNDIVHVSPVLEGFNIVNGSSPGDFITELRNMLAGDFSEMGLPRQRDAETAARYEAAVRDTLADSIEAYRIEPSSRELIGVWPKLDDPKTEDSMIAHVRRAVAEGETNVALVGVSLKYSIGIITRAINGLRPDPSRPAGPLTIELVHVDDQSHILNSLHDTLDIGNIQHYFHIHWPDTKAAWEKACNDVGITVKVMDPVAIDYIPQQVGIRIESVNGPWTVLYAGRCEFEPAGRGTRLLVGERPYFFYSSRSRDPREAEAIKVFNQYVGHYRLPEHNGATLLKDHNEWIERLESCVLMYQDLSEIVLVSNTGQKLFNLIEPALRRGLTVTVYTSHPTLLSPTDAGLVKELEERIRNVIRGKLGGKCAGTVELRYIHHRPTFRAALIGQDVLGLQAYIVQEAIAPSRPLDPSELRLIVTKYSQHFHELQTMVDRILQGAEADTESYATLGAAGE